MYSNWLTQICCEFCLALNASWPVTGFIYFPSCLKLRSHTQWNHCKLANALIFISLSGWAYAQAKT